MHFFYHPNINTNIVSLNEEESFHCIKSLRLSNGNQIKIIDGKGGLYTGNIIDGNSKSCTIEIIEKTISANKSFRLHIAVAPTKNISRFEWFIEKAAEIGIDEITPLICHNSERNKLNPDRLERIIIAAMKQSGNLFKPVVHTLTRFNKFVQTISSNKAPAEQHFIAHYSEKNKNLNNYYRQGANALIIIGPEGDFTKDEITLAMQNHFTQVNLSNNRLRCETAALVACQIFVTLNQ